MIGNSMLQALCDYPDEDTSFNQLLELLKAKDREFLDSLNVPVDLTACNDGEINYLTKASALIDYYLQIHGLSVPGWLRSDKLSFDRPYYHSKRLSDFDKFRLQFTNPAPFRARNTYFELDGLVRV